MKRLSSSQAALFLGIQPQTLRKWRYVGIGPKYIRYGGPKGRTFYDLVELEKFMNERTYSNTTEEYTIRQQKVA